MWVRHTELVTGIAALAFGLIEWSQGWWHWLLIGLGVIGISPWPGVTQILRRAEQRPEVLNHDRDRGYRRARRFLIIAVPVYTIGAGAFGYSYGRWLEAGINVVLLGSGGGLGGAWALRWLRPRPGSTDHESPPTPS